MSTYDYDRVNLIYQPQQSMRRSQQSLLIRLLTLFLILLGLFIILFVLHDVRTSNRPKLISTNNCPTASFDYLQLTISWPVTFCMLESQCRHANDTKTVWGIHGLWPNSNNSKNDPAFCCNSWPFDKNEIKDIESELNKKWFNLNPNWNEDEFLAHEWNKHGTCAKASKPLGSQHSYFASGLNIYNKYPFWDWLAEAGIVPAVNKTYKFDKIQKIIQSKFTKKVKITCESFHVKKVKHLLIDAVEMCFDKSLDPIDCVQKNEQCSGNVYYPLPSQRFH